MRLLPSGARLLLDLEAQDLQREARARGRGPTETIAHPALCDSDDARSVLASLFGGEWLAEKVVDP